MKAQKHPCSDCPWRRDTPPGQFDACRYDALRSTSGEPGREVSIGAPMFACHNTIEGRDAACAGWLAVVGYHHLGVRLAVIMGALDPSALEPGDDWPDLFDTYEEMADAQGR